MLLWEDNNLVRRGLSEAPAVSPEKLQKETLSREVSQESDRETQRWSRAEAEMPFEDLQPLCWVLFTRPAGEPGGNHQTNFEWRASRTECAAAEETARYGTGTGDCFPEKGASRGGGGRRCGGPRRPLLPTSGHWLRFSLEGEMIVLLCRVLFSGPPLLCVCAGLGQGELSTGKGRPGVSKASHLLSPLGRCCLGEGHPAGCRLLGQGFSCFWIQCDWWENIEFSEQVPICPLG